MSADFSRTIGINRFPTEPRDLQDFSESGGERGAEGIIPERVAGVKQRHLRMLMCIIGATGIIRYQRDSASPAMFSDVVGPAEDVRYREVRQGVPVSAGLFGVRQSSGCLGYHSGWFSDFVLRHFQMRVHISKTSGIKYGFRRNVICN